MEHRGPRGRPSLLLGTVNPVGTMGELSLFDLRVIVERIEGRSVCGLKPGDFFEVTESSHIRIPADRHQPAIVPLVAAARDARRIRLGPACLSPFTLHPVEVAGQIAALGLASNGRAYLGLARGAWLEKIGVRPARPVTALRETAE